VQATHGGPSERAVSGLKDGAEQSVLLLLHSEQAAVHVFWPNCSIGGAGPWFWIVSTQPRVSPQSWRKASLSLAFSRGEGTDGGTRLWAVLLG
jgi:hypothetical protein